MTEQEIRDYVATRKDDWGECFNAYRSGFLAACLINRAISAETYANWDWDREDAKDAAVAFIENRFKPVNNGRFDAAIKRTYDLNEEEWRKDNPNTFEKGEFWTK